MQVKKEIKKDAFAVKITVEEDGKEVGRIFLYVLYNHMHTEPFGLFEYVSVDEEYRSKGYGKLLVEELIKEAKSQGCYKLICYARNSHPDIQKWYLKFGFVEWGKEFRMDFKTSNI